MKVLQKALTAELDLVHGKRKITVELALRLAKYFGTTSKFWLNIQNELDLRKAEIRLEKIWKKFRVA